MKHTFASDTFAAKTFAAGAWRGIGADVEILPAETLILWGIGTGFTEIRGIDNLHYCVGNTADFDLLVGSDSRYLRVYGEIEEYAPVGGL